MSDGNISRRFLLKSVAAGGLVGFVGPSKGQTGTDPLAAISTPEFQSAVTDTSYTGDELQREVYTDQAHNFPFEGDSYLVMSSGDATSVLGNPEEFANQDMDGVTIQNYSPDGYEANDVATFVIRVQVPSGADSIAFDYKFGSEENPSWLTSQYQDFFEAVVFPPEDEPRNIALLPDGSPVTVQNSNDYSNSPTGSSQSPSPPFPDSPDSVFNAVTERQTAVWNVSSYEGQEVSLFFRVADASDHILDSAVFIDNLRFAGDIQQKNLGRLQAALDTYETALFDAADTQIRSIARTEARFVDTHGDQYTSNVVDYFGKKAGVVSDPSVNSDVEEVADDALNGGPDAESAAQLYDFYDEMYSGAADMSVDAMTDRFTNYYKGTASNQSNYLTFDTSGSQAEENGDTLSEIIDFTQDCIIGTADTTGLKEMIVQEIASADVTAEAVEAFADSIEKRAANLNDQMSTTSERYEECADVLTSGEDFKCRITIPEVNDGSDQNSTQSQGEALTLGLVGGAALLKYTGGAVVGGTALAYGSTVAVPAAGNVISTGTTTVGSTLGSAGQYLGGTAGAAGGLSSAHAVASAQTMLYFTRVQQLLKFLQFVDKAATTVECGTTAFQDFLNIAQTIAAETSDGGSIQSPSILGTDLADVTVENLQIEDQLSDSNLARGTGSVTITNTGFVSFTPSLEQSNISETVIYTSINTGAEYPIAFGEIPEIQPGESATVDFEYLAPVGGLLRLVTDYELEIVESKSNNSEIATFDTEVGDVELNIPSSTVGQGSISTGEVIEESASTSETTSTATFTLDYDQFDADLHLYDASGNHTGIDYSTGELVNQVPGATHSGDDNGISNQEYVTVSDPGAQDFTVQLVVEEIGTVVQSTSEADTGSKATTERQSIREETQSSTQSVSPLNAEATGAGTTDYSTELTELTPQPATLDLSPTSTTTTSPGSKATTTSISEVGTFQDVSGVSLSLTGDLSRTSDGQTISASNVSFGSNDFTVTAGDSETFEISISVPQGTPPGTYTGMIEASGSSSDGTVSQIAQLTVNVEFSVAGYDLNAGNSIDASELEFAAQDYNNGVISYAQLRQVLRAHNTGEDV